MVVMEREGGREREREMGVAGLELHTGLDWGGDLSQT
jgi:hypothetical protein